MIARHRAACRCVASSGCLVLALQPAYDDASVVYDEALIGEWANTEDETSATIERAAWRSYKVTYADRFATRTFHGNLTKIGTSTFLDLTEVRGADAGPFLLPVHGVFRVTRRRRACSPPRRSTTDGSPARSRRKPPADRPPPSTIAATSSWRRRRRSCGVADARPGGSVRRADDIHEKTMMGRWGRCGGWGTRPTCRRAATASDLSFVPVVM